MTGLHPSREATDSGIVGAVTLVCHLAWDETRKTGFNTRPHPFPHSRTPFTRSGMWRQTQILSANIHYPNQHLPLSKITFSLSLLQITTWNFGEREAICNLKAYSVVQIFKCLFLLTSWSRPLSGQSIDVTNGDAMCTVGG